MKQCSVTGLLDSGLSKDEVDIVDLLRDMDASPKDLDNQEFSGIWLVCSKDLDAGFSVDLVGSFRRIREAYSEELDISFLLIQRCKTVCASLN